MNQKISFVHEKGRCKWVYLGKFIDADMQRYKYLVVFFVLTFFTIKYRIISQFIHTYSLQALCMGEGWIAVATDQQHVRLFSLGGIQREMFSLAGPIVSMAGHTHQLIMAYHQGMGKTYTTDPRPMCND